MAEADNKQQPELNPASANYDPSIPPAEQPRHRGRRCSSCCCCLFRILWWFFVSIIVLVCIVILVLWILIQPRSFKYHVTEAKLTQFNYTTSNILRYNLVVNFTVRNPNKKLKIYYDVAEANAFYQGSNFSTTNVIMAWRSYLQNTKATDRMSAVFSGQRVMVLDHNEFNEDKKDGAFPIDIKLYFRIRFKIGDFIPGDMKPKAKCALKVPSSSDGKMLDAFDPTKCEVDF
ncbi:putative NDR1/HIN1-Like protein 3-like [Sesbania bispinosa]|nr:putative NDR1/HIN1-Like protein 3-like [Sesbania bispinosa]